MFSLARMKHKPLAIPLPAALSAVQHATPLLTSRDALGGSLLKPQTLPRAKRSIPTFAWFAELAVSKMDATAMKFKKARPAPLAARSAPRPDPAAAARQRAVAQATRERAVTEAERADDQGREWCEQRWNYFADEVSRVGVRAAARAVFSTANRSECTLILASMPDARAPTMRTNPNITSWSLSDSSQAPVGASIEKRLAALRPAATKR